MKKYIGFLGVVGWLYSGAYGFAEPFPHFECVSTGDAREIVCKAVESTFNRAGGATRKYREASKALPLALPEREIEDNWHYTDEEQREYEDESPEVVAAEDEADSVQQKTRERREKAALTLQKSFRRLIARKQLEAEAALEEERRLQREADAQARWRAEQDRLAEAQRLLAAQEKQRQQDEELKRQQKTDEVERLQRLRDEEAARKLREENEQREREEARRKAEEEKTRLAEQDRLAEEQRLLAAQAKQRQQEAELKRQQEADEAERLQRLREEETRRDDEERLKTLQPQTPEDQETEEVDSSPKPRPAPRRLQKPPVAAPRMPDAEKHEDVNFREFSLTPNKKIRNQLSSEASNQHLRFSREAKHNNPVDKQSQNVGSAHEKTYHQEFRFHFPEGSPEEHREEFYKTLASAPARFFKESHEKVSKPLRWFVDRIFDLSAKPDLVDVDLTMNKAGSGTAIYRLRDPQTSQETETVVDLSWKDGKNVPKKIRMVLKDPEEGAAFLRAHHARLAEEERLKTAEAEKTRKQEEDDRRRVAEAEAEKREAELKLKLQEEAERKEHEELRLKAEEERQRAQAEEEKIRQSAATKIQAAIRGYQTRAKLEREAEAEVGRREQELTLARQKLEEEERKAREEAVRRDEQRRTELAAREARIAQELRDKENELAALQAQEQRMLAEQKRQQDQAEADRQKALIIEQARIEQKHLRTQAQASIKKKLPKPSFSTIVEESGEDFIEGTKQTPSPKPGTPKPVVETPLPPPVEETVLTQVLAKPPLQESVLLRTTEPETVRRSLSVRVKSNGQLPKRFYHEVTRKNNVTQDNVKAYRDAPHTQARRIAVVDRQRAVSDALGENIVSALVRGDKIVTSALRGGEKGFSRWLQKHTERNGHAQKKFDLGQLKTAIVEIDRADSKKGKAILVFGDKGSAFRSTVTANVELDGDKLKKFDLTDVRSGHDSGSAVGFDEKLEETLAAIPPLRRGTQVFIPSASPPPPVPKTTEKRPVSAEELAAVEELLKELKTDDTETPATGAKTPTLPNAKLVNRVEEIPVQPPQEVCIRLTSNKIVKELTPSESSKEALKYTRAYNSNDPKNYYVYGAATVDQKKNGTSVATKMLSALIANEGDLVKKFAVESIKGVAVHLESAKKATVDFIVHKGTANGGQPGEGQRISATLFLEKKPELVYGTVNKII